MPVRRLKNWLLSAASLQMPMKSFIDDDGSPASAPVDEDRPAMIWAPASAMLPVQIRMCTMKPPRPAEFPRQWLLTASRTPLAVPAVVLVWNRVR